MARTAADDQNFQARTPLERERSRRSGIGLSRAGSRRSFTNLNRDPNKGRRDFVGIAGECQFFNHAAFLKRLGEITKLATLLQQIIQVCENFRTRHVKAADVIRDFHAVAQHDVLSFAAGEMRGDLCDGFVRSAQRKSPPSYAAEKMQLGRRQTDLHFDLPRIIPRHARTALEDDDVLAGGRALRVHDVERHVAVLDRAPLLEPQRFVARLRRHVNAARRVGRECVGQIEDSEALFVRAKIRQHIAQAIRAELLEALGHERPASVAT